MKNLFLLSLIFFTLVSCNNDQKLWQQTLTTNTIEGYKEYLAQFPDGEYKQIAKTKIDSIEQVILQDETDWNTALDENNIDAYKNYLELHPEGIHKKSADSVITLLNERILNEKDIWEKAKLEDSFFSYKQYIDDGNTEHLEEADILAKKKFKEIINKDYPEINDFFYLAKNSTLKDTLFSFFSKIECNLEGEIIKGGINKQSLQINENTDYNYILWEFAEFYKFYKNSNFTEYNILEDDKKQITFTIDYSNDDGESYFMFITFTEEEGKMRITEVDINIYLPGC